MQRVGYRDRIQLLARDYGITGYVKNLEGYDVYIVAEGTPDNLIEFCLAIQISEYPVHVDSIEIHNKEYTGEFPYFMILRGNSDEELAERFDTALMYLARIDKNSQKSADNSELLLSKQDQMLGKQDLLLGKQDISIDLQKETISLQHETITEIRGVRMDICQNIDQRFASIERQLSEVVTALKGAGIIR